MSSDEIAPRTAKTPPLASTQDSAAPTARAVSAQCEATTRQGARCRNAPIPGTRLCYFHTPGAAAAAGKTGGENRRRLPLVLRGAGTVHLETVEEVRLVLADTINRLRAGTIDGKTANALGFLCNISKSVVEASEFEKRLSELESQTAADKRGRRKAK